MTHGDIKTKFLIEYDKANITSSYPSLTEYEINTILDKAYLAILSQKVTTNNPRQIEPEGDNKAIADIQPLITTVEQSIVNQAVRSENDVVYNQPSNMLFFVQARLKTGYNINSQIVYSTVEVKQVTHELAEKYMCSTHNKPWVETPVCYMEDNKIIVLVDPVLHTPDNLFVTYVYNPLKFVGNPDSTVFELSDSMAEELINLAIIFATETVESPRLTTRLNIRPLES